ncbi:hypothetical protein VNO78_28559 [Psophocarpus tetragonolobus]|uniref:Uncharacterized protein n=1 Tax=Psophocarpus tetragonolobus TaxID=3891 RepID=A0AAN9XBU9_PSOTE
MGENEDIQSMLNRQSGKLLHTTGEDALTKWIFVLSTSNILYVGKKKKGSFQHSSFLAGGATSCAGRLVVEYGMQFGHSGHYRPTEENFKEFISFLLEKDVQFSDAKEILLLCADDFTKRSSTAVGPKPRQFQIFGRELTSLKIPTRSHMTEGLENEKEGTGKSSNSFQMDSPTGDEEPTQAFPSEGNSCRANGQRELDRVLAV